MEKTDAIVGLLNALFASMKDVAHDEGSITAACFHTTVRCDN